MNSKIKCVKKKPKILPKKILSTPRKSSILKDHHKDFTPPTAATKHDMTLTLRKHHLSKITLNDITAENRSSLISMLITQSSNVSLDSPLFLDEEVSQPSDEELIKMVKKERNPVCQSIVSRVEKAVIKVQRLWRWHRTKAIVQEFMNKDVSFGQFSITSDLDKYLHTPTKNQNGIKENKREPSQTSENDPLLESCKKHFPSIGLLRISDLNTLLSKQISLTEKKFQSECYFTNEQLSMDIISESQYGKQLEYFKEIREKKEVDLGEYSRLAEKVMKDVKKILAEAVIGDETQTSRSNKSERPSNKWQKSASCEELISKSQVQSYIANNLKRKQKLFLDRKRPDAPSKQSPRQQLPTTPIKGNQPKPDPSEKKEEIKARNIPEPRTVTSISVSSEAVQMIAKKILQYALNTEEGELKNLAIPLGMTPSHLLRAYNSNQEEIPTEIDVLSSHIFQEFQKIYLREIETMSMKQGRILTMEFKKYIHYHNEAIFDALNEGLEFQRKHGINGYPLPWKPESISNLNSNIERTLIRVIDYLLDIEDCHCGYLSEHFYRFNSELPFELLMEVRAQKQITAEMLELRNEREDWNNYELNQCFILLDINGMLADWLIQEAVGEIASLIN